MLEIHDAEPAEEHMQACPFAGGMSERLERCGSVKTSRVESSHGGEVKVLPLGKWRAEELPGQRGRYRKHEVTIVTIATIVANVICRVESSDV